MRIRLAVEINDPRIFWQTVLAFMLIANQVRRVEVININHAVITQASDPVLVALVPVHHINRKPVSYRSAMPPEHHGGLTPVWIRLRCISAQSDIGISSTQNIQRPGDNHIEVQPQILAFPFEQLHLAPPSGVCGFPYALKRIRDAQVAADCAF